MKKLKFGSVAWQNQELKRITRKMKENKPLDARDRVFLDVQAIHNMNFYKKLEGAI